MNHYTLRRARDVPLHFSGDIIAEVSTRDVRPRWVELRLYRLPSGGYVAEQVARSTVDGECDRHSAWICARRTDVRRRLGNGPLAQQLYLEAGFDGVEAV